MRTLLITVLAALVLLSGCGRKFHLNEERLAAPSPWPWPGADLAGTGSVSGNGFEGHLDVLWEASSNDKPSGPLTLHYDALVYAGAKGRTKFYDLRTGDYLGSIGSSRRTSQTGLSTTGPIACWATAPPRDQLVCVNLQDRGDRWERPVKDAASGTIILEDRVLVASSFGTLIAYELADGRPAWSFESPVRLTAPPTYNSGTVYQPADDGLLFFVSATDGTKLVEVDLDGHLVAAVTAGEDLFAAVMEGRVYCIDRVTGHAIWQKDLPGRCWTSPVVTSGRLLVACSSGEVLALDPDEGGEIWRLELDEVIRAPVTAVGDFGLVGTLAGSLISFRLADGQTVDRRQLQGGIDRAPVSDGERVYVATRAGKLTCFGVEDVAEKSDHQRGGPDGKSQ